MPTYEIIAAMAVLKNIRSEIQHGKIDGDQYEDLLLDIATKLELDDQPAFMRMALAPTSVHDALRAINRQKFPVRKHPVQECPELDRRIRVQDLPRTYNPRAKFALSMRKRGLSFAKISDLLGLSRDRARQIIRDGIRAPDPWPRAIVTRPIELDEDKTFERGRWYEDE